MLLWLSFLSSSFSSPFCSAPLGVEWLGMVGGSQPHFHSLTLASSVRRAHCQTIFQMSSSDGKAVCKPITTAFFPDSNFSVSTTLNRTVNYRLPEVPSNVQHRDSFLPELHPNFLSLYLKSSCLKHCCTTCKP